MATNVEISGTGVAALAGLAVIGVIGMWIYSNRDAIKGAVQAVNPASDQNVAYKAANVITQSVTGDKGTSFGSWLYDVTHPNQPDITAPTPLRAQTGWDDIMLRRAREQAAGVLGDAGFVEALGESGRKELVPPMTPATWLLIAGASAALYAHQKRNRRSRGRGRRHAS